MAGLHCIFLYVRDITIVSLYHQGSQWSDPHLILDNLSLWDDSHWILLASFSSLRTRRVRELDEKDADVSFLFFSIVYPSHCSSVRPLIDYTFSPWNNGDTTGCLNSFYGAIARWPTDVATVINEGGPWLISNAKSLSKTVYGVTDGFLSGLPKRCRWSTPWKLTLMFPFAVDMSENEILTLVT